MLEKIRQWLSKFFGKKIVPAPRIKKPSPEIIKERQASIDARIVAPKSEAIKKQEQSFQADANRRCWPSLSPPPEVPQSQNHVYIFTVGRHAFIREKSGLLPETKIPACLPSERFHLITCLPDPIMRLEFSPITDSGKELVIYDAKRAAMDFCWPDNLTLDLDMTEEELQLAGFVLSPGANYTHQGLFWSTQNPPTEEEIAAAEARLVLPFSCEARLGESVCEHGRPCLTISLKPSASEIDEFAKRLTEGGFKIEAEPRAAGEITVFSLCSLCAVESLKKLLDSKTKQE